MTLSPEAARILHTFAKRNLHAGDIIRWTDFGDAVVWEGGFIRDAAVRDGLTQLLEADLVIEFNAALGLTPAGEHAAYAGTEGTGDAIALLRAAYAPLIDFAREVDEQVGWTPTELPGWCVRDLIFHLAMDAQRALVALASPSSADRDTDEVSYWRAWQPGTEAAQAGLRGIRVAASAWASVRGPADLFAETASAVLATAGRTDLAATVSTQGHTMTTDGLLRTLVVEATIHHLDFGPALPVAPATGPLEEVRRVLDALLGQPVPATWADDRYARIATGRLALSPQERRQLGQLADRFPLFG